MQLAWYSTRIPGNSSLAALASARGGSLTLAGATQPSSASASNTTTGSNAPSVTSPPCVLWGVPDSDPASYMSALCVAPYQGRLCATCAPGHALSADFECLE
jgi:hypothetical protein